MKFFPKKNPRSMPIERGFFFGFLLTIPHALHHARVRDAADCVLALP